MKPLKLEMQAFGPYPGTEVIDFEKLADKGIYLIKGETGSGKTAIFDAIVMALYGECGDKSRGKIEEWRCTQAPKEVETRISFTFFEHGHTYRFTRRYGVKKSAFSLTCEAGEIDENGNEIPLSANLGQRTMNEKAAEIIGLDREQFTQVVMLPQGKFEQFLLEEEGKKEAILSKIFGTEKWSKFVNTFADAVKKRKDELMEACKEVQNVLAANGVQDMAGLADKIAEIKQRLADLEADHTAFDAEGKKKQLDADKELSREFDTLHTLEQTRDNLTAQLAIIEAKKTTLAKADAAEPFRGLMDAATRDKAEAQKRQNELITLTNKAPGVDKAVQTANDDLQKHVGASPVDTLNKEIGEYETKKADYANLDDLRKALQGATAVWNAKNAEKTAAENTVNVAKDKVQKARETYQAARDAAEHANDAYYDGIYGELAQNLRDGEKCPVCGSVSHPAPATRTAESVTREEMTAAQKAAKVAQDALEAADASCRDAEKAVKEASDALAQTETAKATAQAKYDNAKNNMIPGIADAAALVRAIADKQNKIKLYQDRERQLRVAVQAAENAKSTLDAQISTAKEEWEKAEQQTKASATALADALNKAGYPEDGDAVRAMMRPEQERNVLREAIAKYDQSCKENSDTYAAQQAKVAGKTEPDKTSFGMRDKEIADELQKYHVEKGRLENESKRLTVVKRDLEPKEATYRDNIGQAESDERVAKLLRGDNSMGLQRYVLAVMFGQVVGEANRMLQKVHGGRYTLCRTDEANGGQRKCGLSLRVLDARKPEAGMRNVASLSGGEKFLVSLALSIGLSTFAQRTGVRIEALFIDEGFGTLDDKSITDAMMVLDSVRSGGTVGIISHVKLLEENIPTQIEIIKTDEGSHIA